MKENSIEEDIKILEEFKTHGYAMLLMKYEDRNKTNLKIDQAIKNILSDYKRVLKENEELRQEKIDNQKINLLAQNSMLDYQNGYEDGKANRRSAVQSIIDNQQYYIFQKQIEKYEKEIEKLQKENEELKLKYKLLYNGKIEMIKARELKIPNSVVSKQKIKDKIEHYQKLQDSYIEKYDKISKGLQAMINALQELLEGRR